MTSTRSNANNLALHMLTTYAARFVYAIAVLLSVTSITLVLSAGAAALVVIAFSLSYNLWSLVKSERGGFGDHREMRRAHEPPRRFGPMQTLSLIALVMAQVGTGTYALLAAG